MNSYLEDSLKHPKTLIFAVAFALAWTGSLAFAAAPLRVGLCPNSPPMVFRDGNSIVGVEPDFAAALGKELNREVRLIELAWEDLLDSLNEGKIDIIMSSMSITTPRQVRVAFSEPYLRTGQMALVRSEDQYRFGPLANSLARQTIGVKKATTGDLVVQQEFPKATRKYFQSGEEAAKALQKKKIDLFINDSTMIWYLAGHYEGEGLVVAPMVLSDEVLAWALNRSDTTLLNSVNAFLKKIKSNGELDKILRRWIPKLQ